MLLFVEYVSWVQRSRNGLDKSNLSIWQIHTFPQSFNSYLHVLIIYCCYILLSNVSHKAGYSVETFDEIFSLFSIVIYVAWVLLFKKKFQFVNLSKALKWYILIYESKTTPFLEVAKQYIQRPFFGKGFWLPWPSYVCFWYIQGQTILSCLVYRRDLQRLKPSFTSRMLMV